MLKWDFRVISAMIMDGLDTEVDPTIDVASVI